MLDDLAVPELSAAQFGRISALVHDACGIALRDGKEGLVRARLLKRLRVLELRSFADYLLYLERDSNGDELTTMIDVITTNKTSFFREPEHFEYLREAAIPRLSGEGVPIRIWSAGCSSGEEPYSLAIAVRDALADVDRRDVRILGTDISTRMLAQARAATYDADQLVNVSPALLRKHFEPLFEGATEQRFRVRDPVRRLVALARLNLLADWPMRGPFDAIFCRNVMIYFDQATRERLIERFWLLIRPGGHLFLGSSESLTGIESRFRYIQPAVYAR